MTAGAGAPAQGQGLRDGGLWALTMGTRAPLCWSGLGGPHKDGRAGPSLGLRTHIAMFPIPAVGPVSWDHEDVDAAVLRPSRQHPRRQAPEQGGDGRAGLHPRHFIPPLVRGRNHPAPLGFELGHSHVEKTFHSHPRTHMHQTKDISSRCEVYLSDAMWPNPYPMQLVSKSSPSCG